jgi:hypothetical protein
MPTNSIQSGNPDSSSLNSSVVKCSLYQAILRNAVWLLGILPWVFSVVDLGYTVFTHGGTTPANIARFVTAMFLFGGWLYLKPSSNKRIDEDVAFQGHKLQSHNISSIHRPHHLNRVDARMMELQSYHLIGREYVLPFPYLCQIYHLLNLKHLETVHSFSLSNLKVLGVDEFQPTVTGGKLRFQTTLDSPFNILRLWRQDIVEVDLILHTPFTVELRVPVRDQKTINVIFNVVPLGEEEHKLCVDIYSNLPWPKPILRFLLEFATSLTLLEDLPYLRVLTAHKQSNLVDSNQLMNRKQSKNDSMQLYYRYVSLYKSTLSFQTNEQFTPDSNSYELEDDPVV